MTSLPSSVNIDLAGGTNNNIRILILVSFLAGRHITLRSTMHTSTQPRVQCKQLRADQSSEESARHSDPFTEIQLMLFACVYLSIVSDINTCTEIKSGCVKHITVQKKYFFNAIDFLQFICTCILELRVVECSKEG